VIVLRFYADLSLEQIAEQTGERLGTVKSRLHYALEALRAAYDAGSREGSR
jgi:RNA polymerase sigma-70 factor (ECF subfamily)